MCVCVCVCVCELLFPVFDLHELSKIQYQWYNYKEMCMVSGSTVLFCHDSNSLFVLYQSYMICEMCMPGSTVPYLLGDQNCSHPFVCDSNYSFVEPNFIYQGAQSAYSHWMRMNSILPSRWLYSITKGHYLRNLPNQKIFRKRSHVTRRISPSKLKTGN